MYAKNWLANAQWWNRNFQPALKNRHVTLYDTLENILALNIMVNNNEEKNLFSITHKK